MGAGEEGSGDTSAEVHIFISLIFWILFFYVKIEVSVTRSEKYIYVRKIKV